MKPAAVLDAQNDLMLRLNKGGAFTSSVAHQFRVQGAEGDRMANGIAQHLRMADAYRVTDEMSTLVQFAASKLDDSDRVDRTMPPTSWGFVRFDRPLPIREARGRQMLGHYLVWGQATREMKNSFGALEERPALMLSWWNDLYDGPDEVAALMMKEKDPAARRRLAEYFGRWGFCGAEVVLDGQRMGPPTDRLTFDQQAAILADGDSPAEETTNTVRYAHALWLLLGQTITRVEQEEIPRAAQKHIGRMEIPGRVSVITLRRTAGSRSEGESAVQWSHRWVVRGHWRWQPYADGRVERIWIHPFIKGPPGLPFAVTQHVYQLSR